MLLTHSAVSKSVVSMNSVEVVSVMEKCDPYICLSCIHRQVCHWYRRDGGCYNCDNYEDKSQYFKMPPCKIGDFVWTIRSYKGIKHAQQGKITDMFFTKEMRLMIVVSHIARGSWGDKIFATEAEAEAKTNEMNKKG